MPITSDSKDDWEEDWSDDDSWEEEDDETIDCPECGTNFSAMADLCPECGHWLLDEEPTTGFQDFGVRIGGKRTKSIFFTIVVVLLLISFLLLTVF